MISVCIVSDFVYPIPCIILLIHLPLIYFTLRPRSLVDFKGNPPPPPPPPPPPLYPAPPPPPPPPIVKANCL